MKLKNKTRTETTINFPYFKLKYNKTIKHNYNVVLSLRNTRGGTKQFPPFFYHQILLLQYNEISIYHKVKFCFSTKSPSLLTHFFPPLCGTLCADHVKLYAEVPHLNWTASILLCTYDKFYRIKQSLHSTTDSCILQLVTSATCFSLACLAIIRITKISIN